MQLPRQGGMLRSSLAIYRGPHRKPPVRSSFKIPSHTSGIGPPHSRRFVPCLLLKHGGT